MRTLAAIVTVLAGPALAQPLPPAPGASADLVRVTDGGEFVEVERKPDFSLVEVRRAPAGSVPSSLFAVKGACAVMRARGEQFFSSSPVPATVPTHRLSFPRAPSQDQLAGPKKSVFSLADCDLLRF